MIFVYNYGNEIAPDTPHGEVLQRWRISLASFLFFTIFGVTSSIKYSENLTMSSGMCGDPPLGPWAPQSVCHAFHEITFLHQMDNFTKSPTTGHQCLSQLDQQYEAQDKSFREFCALSVKQRMENLRYDRNGRFNVSTLTFCDKYSAISVLGNFSNDFEHFDNESCVKRLKELQRLDKAALSAYCAFDNVMDKYDCEQQNYSIKWNCNDCRVSKLRKNFCARVQTWAALYSSRTCLLTEFCIRLLLAFYVFMLAYNTSVSKRGTSSQSVAQHQASARLNTLYTTPHASQIVLRSSLLASLYIASVIGSLCIWHTHPTCPGHLACTGCVETLLVEFIGKALPSSCQLSVFWSPELLRRCVAASSALNKLTLGICWRFRNTTWDVSL